VDLPRTLAGPAVSGSADCDCACALELSSAAIAPQAAGSWVKQSPLLSIPLDGDWQACFNPAGPVGVTALNTQAWQVLTAFESPTPVTRAAERLAGMGSTVVRDALHNLALIGLIRPMDLPALPPVRPSILSTWLHVTEACNLNCPYCYVRKRPRSMSVEVGHQVVDRLVDLAIRHGYTTLKLKYAGGEPTLRFSLVQQIHAHAARLAGDVGLDLEEVVLSNGVDLPDATLDFVARAGMQLMISLDGGPAAHDRQRTGRDGRGTYASVVGTVERAMERGLQPNISITLTALSLDGAGEAVAFALERDLPFNLNFYRECASAESSGSPSALTPDPAQLLEAMRGIFDLLSDYPAYSRPLTGILDRTRLDVPHNYPCSAGRDYLAVDPTGRVSACQMLLEEPWADLSDADPLDRVRRQGRDLFKAVDQRSTCQGCFWQKACSGGCPLVRRTAQQGGYCQVYQALFPELVRLEAQRLIASQMLALR
jgi:uncharacterized protein